MTVGGDLLLSLWKGSGLTQRDLATTLNMGFNSLHGRIYRSQVKLKERNRLLKHQSYEPVLLKAAVFDIECMDFTASGLRDYTVCACILPLEDDTITTLRLDYEHKWDDRYLLEDIIKTLEEYDILIGHNIAAFDFNWLNSRIMYHGLNGFNKRFMYYDTYQAAKRMAIKCDRKSLAFLADFFRVPNGKTSIYPVSWGMVDSHNPEEFEYAMSEIIQHCQNDVQINREIFWALWPRDRSMLNLPIAKKL